MLTFNLLPPERKKELRFYRKAIAVIRLVKILTGFCAVFTLFTVFILSSIHAQKIAFETMKETKTGSAIVSIVKKTKKETTAFNKELQELDRAFPDRAWSHLLLEIARNTPETIRIKDIAHEKAKDKEAFLIFGYAARREDLIIFEETLKKSTLLINVTSPLSNFRKPEDIEFTINAELAPIPTPTNNPS